MPDTLIEARKIVEAGREHGVKCPCCDQFAKEYRRKLSSLMARGLIWCVAEYIQKQDWIHVNSKAPRFMIKGGDFAQLLHWGLIIRKPNDKSEKHSSGLYMPTTQGIAFARSKITVPAYVYLYNSKVHGFDKEETDIVTSLGKHFDYEELIETYPVYSYQREEDLPAHLREMAS